MFKVLQFSSVCVCVCVYVFRKNPKAIRYCRDKLETGLQGTT